MDPSDRRDLFDFYRYLLVSSGPPLVTPASQDPSDHDQFTPLPDEIPSTETILRLLTDRIASLQPEESPVSSSSIPFPPPLISLIDRFTSDFVVHMISSLSSLVSIQKVLDILPEKTKQRIQSRLFVLQDQLPDNSELKQLIQFNKKRKKEQKKKTKKEKKRKKHLENSQDESSRITSE
jgi:hypothetical protein